MSIVDSEALTHSVRLRVLEGVDAFHSLREVATHVPDDLEKLILIEALRNPKGNVFVTGGELRVWLEFSDFSLLELADEAGILTPEEADILDIKKFHGPALQTQTESPANFVLDVFPSSVHNLVMDDAAA